MNPINVMLGLFLAVGGMVLGHTLSVAIEEAQKARKARYEWAKRKQRENDHE